LPASGKVYISGKLHPQVRVPLREVQLNPTKGMNGRTMPNESVRVYDCSGPWGDPAFTGGVEHGLPQLRRPWILVRGDVPTRRKVLRAHRWPEHRGDSISA
jgi:phosphomethylpyrimidine synthase